jgi:amino acid transporter
MKLIAVAVILLVAAVNYRGVGESIKLNIAITAVELSGLLFIILVGARVLVQGDGNPGQSFEFEGTGFGVLTGITAGASIIYQPVGFTAAMTVTRRAGTVVAEQDPDHRPRGRRPALSRAGVRAALG